MAKLKDIFSQLFRLTVLQSAANTLTFGASLNFGIPIVSETVIIIHRLEFSIALATLALMTADADAITLGLVTKNTLTAMTTDQIEVIDLLQYERRMTTSGSYHTILPIVHDFSSLPGGGLLIVPQDLFLGMDSTGLASAGTAFVRCHYTFRTLSQSEYLEIAQKLKVFGN